MAATAVSKPVPAPTPTTQPYWDGAKQNELLIQRCVTTGKSFTYPRRFSPFVVGGGVEWVKASGRGTLYSYVINYLPGPGYKEDVPYVIAVVSLEEGPRVLANIVGVEPLAENLPLDMPLVVDFEPRGELNVAQFRPEERA